MKRVLGFIGLIWGIACAYALVGTFVSKGDVSALRDIARVLGGVGEGEARAAATT